MEDEEESLWGESVRVFKSSVVGIPVKAIVRKVVDGKQIVLSFFTPYVVCDLLIFIFHSEIYLFCL